MTNEDLIVRFYAGEDTRLQLYNRIRNLISSIARRVAVSYYCMQFTDTRGKRTVYTKQILEDLRDEGMLEFFRVIELGKYDPAQGKFTTYIYPFLEGAMRRWMESNLGCLSVSKDDMERIRNVQRVYHSEGKTVCQIAEENGLDEKTVQRDLNYNTHLLPLSALENPDETMGEPMLIEDDVLTVDTAVYQKICADLLEPIFFRLSEQDRFILGSWFGVFGYEEKSDDDVAFELILTDDGLRKAKKAALGRLAEKIPGSRLEEWKIVHRAVVAECRRDYDPDAIEDEGYEDRPKIFIRW